MCGGPTKWFELCIGMIVPGADLTNVDLKLAEWTGTAWNIQPVDSEGSVGWDSSLVLTPTTTRYNVP